MSGPGFQIHSQCRIRAKAVPLLLIPEIGRKSELEGGTKKEEKRIGKGKGDSRKLRKVVKSHG